MNEKKGYKPLKKTLSYMRRMINAGRWKANSRIPTLALIAMRVGTSVNTVRKAVGQLEHDRLIDNNGSLGFCVVPPDMTKLFHSNKQLYYLRLLKSNVKALEMMDEGAKPVGKYIVSKSDLSVVVHNVLSGETVDTTVEEIEESVHHPLSLAALVSLSGSKLAAEKKRYFRQQKLREIAKVVLKTKETLR